MITPRLYEGLDAEERKLWHSHDYEVSSTQDTLLALPYSVPPKYLYCNNGPS